MAASQLSDAGPGDLPVRTADRLTQHRIRNGNHIYAFQARVLAAATSRRPGHPRWTELVIYQLKNGTYMVSRIGRSQIAHDPGCNRVTSKMVPYLEAGEEARIHRVPCPECFPRVGDAMDPQTVLEASRFTALQAPDPSGLYDVLAAGSGNRIVGMTLDLITQLVASDPVFRSWWQDRTGH